MNKAVKNIIRIPSVACAGVIRVYQAVLSPDHSWLKARFPYGFCRHYPTCSEYSRQSLLKFGLIKGIFLSFKRILSCNPWTEPKIDLIPN